MDKKDANNLIRDVFSKKFDENKFITFTNTLLYSANFDSFIVEGNKIPDQYKEHIESLKRLAFYKDSDNNNIDLLVVTLLKDTALERARTMQRNFVANYLRVEAKEAALVAFIHPKSSHWRFSLIKMDLSFEGIQVKESFTPAKRWSFLVGENEGTHTAQSQLVNILANDNKTPTLEDLEQSFSVETVTDEFFKKYTDLFNRIREALDELLESDESLESEFKDKEIDISDFTKKTMGQIAFLYFLQKKGWFGVAPGKEWGTGVKNFLREVFERRKKYGDNFFDDVLEPLFYEALAQDRGNESIYPKLNNCRMPFLNGGLFEPMNGYSWETTNILLPDELFSNKNETKEGDIGDGILDVFDRYNFTVNEFEPLDQEVAVDPEMLGKVFENLLEVTNRKSKGAFYTPREIVHYMCQESLINFLETAINNSIPKTDIALLIQQGSQITQNDKSFFEQGAEKGELLLPQTCINQVKKLDELLADIKVCDPAVGSGAFPIGMLNEIVSARTVLGVHLRTNPSAYNLKLHAISNSLYGVDIDPGAIEIAKLRFWLSLVVEEDSPSPLPNLEHKIMQGNSLVSHYEGIELFDDEFLNNTKLIKDEIDNINEELKVLTKELSSLQKSGELDEVKKLEFEKTAKSNNRRLNFLRKKTSNVLETRSLFDEPQEILLAQEKARLLQSKVAQYIHLDSKSNKENLKKEIDDLKWDLIEITLKQRNEIEKLSLIKQQRENRIKPFFIWKLEFAEVFNKKNGFDIVIGNPPYNRFQNIEEDLRPSYKEIFNSATGKYDLYVLFIEKGLQLLSNKGVLNFIIPHKWINAAYGKGLRKYIKNHVRKIISFKAFKVFHASTYTGIFWFERKKRENFNYLELDKDLQSNQELEQYLNSLSSTEYGMIANRDLDDKAWVLANPKIAAVLTKLNKQSLRISDVFEYISQGTVSTGDHIFHLEGKFIKDNFVGFSKALNKKIIIEKDIVKPLLKGGTVKKYTELNNNGMYIIYPHFLDHNNQTKPYEENDLKNMFPLAYNYLLNFKDTPAPFSRAKDQKKIERSLIETKLFYKTNASYWYSLHNARQISVFEQKKIITPETSHGSNMAIDADGFYLNTQNYSLVKKKAYSESYEFYLAILNSKLFWFYIKNTGSVLSGGYFRFKTDFLKPFPLPEILNIEDTRPFEELVTRIVENNKLNLDVEGLELQVDNLVYELYGLTDNEIEVVEGLSSQI